MGQLILIVGMFSENIYSCTTNMWIFWILPGIVVSIENIILKNDRSLGSIYSHELSKSDSIEYE